MDDIFYVISVEDYHELGAVADSFRGLKKKVKSEEVGFGSDCNYWGIIWTGKKPNKATINQALKKAGFRVVDHENYDGKYGDMPKAYRIY